MTLSNVTIDSGSPFNTAIGANALATNTTGTNNTAIGFEADVSAGNLTNPTAVGNGAIVDASDKIRPGNNAVTVIEGQVAYSFTSDSEEVRRGQHSCIYRGESLG